MSASKLSMLVKTTWEAFEDPGWMIKGLGLELMVYPAAGERTVKASVAAWE